MVLVASFASIGFVCAQPGQATLKPTDDTFVDSSNPNSNYGGQNYLEIENYQYTVLGQTYNCERIVWLKFDLSSVPNGAVVDEATLQLYTSSVGETFDVHAYSGFDLLNVSAVISWTELALTYSNMPGYNATSMDSALVATSDRWYNWSVVDAARNALNSTAKTVTIVLSEPSPHSSTSNVWFDSKESPVYSTDYSPKLTVHWSGVVPEFPSFLILAMFMIATVLAVVIYKKRTVKIERLVQIRKTS
jgi:hypothetical protein